MEKQKKSIKKSFEHPRCSFLQAQLTAFSLLKGSAEVFTQTYTFHEFTKLIQVNSLSQIFKDFAHDMTTFDVWYDIGTAFIIGYF